MISVMVCVRRSGFSLLCAALLLASTHLLAQTTTPTVYVSTGSGQQLVAVDGSSGAITAACNLGFVAEDVVVGPDGNVYVANTLGNKIYRIPAPVTASCTPQIIYDQSTCGAACPTGPEGPSFLRVTSLDLYFNTHSTASGGSTGVWRIPGVASSGCVAPSCPAPVQVSNRLNANSSGEGVDFDIFGNLLAVDQANNVVRRAIAPGFSSVSTLISGLSSPFGVALNTCGDVLVATGKNVNRYSSTSGSLLDSISFTGNNKPKFLEVDSANRLYVVTASDESGSSGTLYRYDPPGAGTNAAVTSCALRSFNQVFSLPFKSGVSGLTSSNALGLGLSATNVALTGTLGPNNPTAVFNFGAQHSFSVTCNAPTSTFTMTVTALKSRPTDAQNAEVTFSPATGFPSPTTTQCPTPITQPLCMHYGSQHGFCTQYLETATVDANAACGSFTFKAGFFAAEFINEPGGAHSAGTTSTDSYTDCQSQDFYSTAGPGLDSGTRLLGSNSKHVVFNSGLQFNGAITLTSPVSSCTPTGCNPQFNSGQNIAIKFRLADNTGAAINNATEQLSILRVSHTGVPSELVPQTIVSTNNSNTLNFFNANSSGQYAYNDDSSAFDPLPPGTKATYQFTIWGNGASPFTFTVVVQF